MRKQIIGLLATAALFHSQASIAGPWTVGAQTIAYSSTTTHILGDGSDIRGGIPPAYGYMPADIPSDFTESVWIHTSATGTDFKGVGVGTEAKARFDCEFGFSAKDDPIIFPGVANGSLHQHSFLGKRLDLLGLRASDATYASLRGSGTSGCYGGNINRTLYWEAEPNKTLTNGVTVGIKVHTFASYYIGGLIGHTGDIYDPAENVVWPRGWNTISGFNMADPTNSRLTAILAAANAASHSGKYSASTIPVGFLGWYCETPVSGDGSVATSPVVGGHQPWLRNTDLTPTLNCAPNTNIIADLITMPCWDGVNLTSPDGRQHMMPAIVDNDISKEVCPEHWYRVPTFEAKAFFYQKGQSDYTNWWLSSDRMPGMTQFRNGESMHFDVFPAWSYGTVARPGVFLRFMNHCAGVTIKLAVADTPMAGDPHECDYGAFGANERVFVNEPSPDGSSPNPIVNLAPDHTGPGRYIKPAVGTPIPGTVHNTH